MEAEPACHLYCTACRLVLVSHFNITKLFNDHILFLCLVYIGESSFAFLVDEYENRSFFFLTFCCIITPISGIIDHYYIMENWKKCLIWNSCMHVG